MDIDKGVNCKKFLDAFGLLQECGFLSEEIFITAHCLRILSDRIDYVFRRKKTD